MTEQDIPGLPRSSMSRKADEAEIQQLLETFEIDDDVRADLQLVRPLVEANIDSVLGNFYERLLSDDAMKTVFENKADPKRAQKLQRLHWLDWVFAAKFDAAYLARCKRIGKAHKVHGVIPAFYLFGYHFMSRHLKSLILETFNERAEADRLITSVEKALFLDIDLAISVYCTEMTAGWRQASLYDELTGTLNRRGIQETLSQMHSSSISSEKPLGIALFDVDHFKKINDTYGHDAGDVALSSLANVVQNQLRDGDTLGRWGGEEFIILMPEASVKGGEQVADRIRCAIEDHHFRLGPAVVTMTASFGVSQVSSFEETIDDAVARADAALYAAKAAGRNKVVCRAAPKKPIR